jgi:S-adenosylmethionine-diacylglycerol 3-amino-3-carboxypropyl transferase
MFSREGVLERIFTLAFRGLVYPQIWEHPAVDLEAMQIRPTDHVLAIGSGGCNILNYLVVDPARISAIDLNGAHIALIRLKLCALRHLPDYDSFFRFYACFAKLERNPSRSGHQNVFDLPEPGGGQEAGRRDQIGSHRRKWI